LSLVRGPTARRGTLYDKWGEVLARSRRARNPTTRKIAVTNLDRAQGVLRYELRLRQSALQKLDITTVSTLTMEPLAVQHRRCFAEFGFGQEVAGMADIVHKVLRREDPQLRVQTRLMLLGVTLAEYYNEEVALSDDTRRKYGRLQQELGLAPADFASSAAPVRLDYDSGTEIVVDTSLKTLDG